MRKPRGKAKPKFSAPSLMVQCPSCGVPEGCACRTIQLDENHVVWGLPRVPHSARLTAYDRWKGQMFGPGKVINFEVSV